ncbi:MAG: hypothetical protein GXP62_06085 [Oligoflexia bacterium]|nr:hypothetical protein [Oligoflexia bacterium]
MQRITIPLRPQTLVSTVGKPSNDGFTATSGWLAAAPLIQAPAFFDLAQSAASETVDAGIGPGWLA